MKFELATALLQCWDSISGVMCRVNVQPGCNYLPISSASPGMMELTVIKVTACCWLITRSAGHGK